MTVPRRSDSTSAGLFLAEVEQVAAREHEPVVLAQLLERGDQRCPLLGGDCPPLGRRSRVSRGKLVCGAQGEPLAPARGAAAVARLVRDDREQPRAKRRAAPEARQRAPGLRQADLGGVLGVGGVAGDQVRGAESDLLVVADERGEGGGVTATCALDELVLCRWSAHHSVLLHPLGNVGSVARAVGINHIALEVGSLDEALDFYGSLFELELRGRIRGMAFVDMGDQFLALAQGRHSGATASPTRSATSASSSTTAAAVLAAAREAGVEIFGGNSFRDPWGNHVQVVEYGDVQFTKTPEILRGMGLELEKSESALRELRDKGLA